MDGRQDLGKTKLERLTNWIRGSPKQLLLYGIPSLHWSVTINTGPVNQQRSDGRLKLNGARQEHQKEGASHSLMVKMLGLIGVS